MAPTLSKKYRDWIDICFQGIGDNTLSENVGVLANRDTILSPVHKIGIGRNSDF